MTQDMIARKSIPARVQERVRVSECELGELAYLALPAVFLTCLIGPRERRMGSYLSHWWRREPKQLYLWLWLFATVRRRTWLFATHGGV